MRHALVVLSALSSLAAAQETVHGAVIFSRHGDRTWKGAPPTKLTTLGQNQMFESGQYWRARYVSGDSERRIAGINSDRYASSQINTTAPDQALLVTSAQVFLQGLYPPSEFREELGNSTTVTSPLEGLQYPLVHSVQANSPDTIWLKGDESCTSKDVTEGYVNLRSEYKGLEELTRDFYLGFYDRVFAGVLERRHLNFNFAYTIFDYVNVGINHNKTIREAVSDHELFELRTYAERAEFMMNGGDVLLGDTTNPLAVGARTFAEGVLQQLKPIASKRGAGPKLSLMVGSYDTFIAFFGLAGLAKHSPVFQRLPDYASTMVFELFSQGSSFPSSDNDLFVRFLFRNGTTDGPAIEYPLFGRGRSNAVMRYPEFTRSMSDIAITSVEEWCTYCGNAYDSYCREHYRNSRPAAAPGSQRSEGALSPTVAGVVGAMCTLATVLIGVAIAMLFGVRLRRNSKTEKLPPAKEVDNESIA